MDIIDKAQEACALFQRTALANRQFDLAPQPPQREDDLGNALCVDCDLDITERRRIIPNAQRCAECQLDHEARSRR